MSIGPASASATASSIARRLADAGVRLADLDEGAHAGADQRLVLQDQDVERAGGGHAGAQGVHRLDNVGGRRPRQPSDTCRAKFRT